LQAQLGECIRYHLVSDMIFFMILVGGGGGGFNVKMQKVFCDFRFRVMVNERDCMLQHKNHYVCVRGGPL